MKVCPCSCSKGWKKKTGPIHHSSHVPQAGLQHCQQDRHIWIDTKLYGLVAQRADKYPQSSTVSVATLCFGSRRFSPITLKCVRVCQIPWLRTLMKRAPFATKAKHHQRWESDEHNGPTVLTSVTTEAVVEICQINSVSPFTGACRK